MSQELVVKEQQENVFALFDKLDDDIILAEIENRVVSTWVYHFIQDGQDIWGLSKKGVDQALMELEKQGIIYDEPIVSIQPDPTDPDYILFFANIRKFRYDAQIRKIDLGSVSGYKRQCIKHKSGVNDPFWFEKGAAKATRNAKARTIPVEIETKIIALAKTQGKVKQIDDVESEAKDVNDKLATEKQKNYLKGLVAKKLDGDWNELCAEFNFRDKEELLSNATVKEVNRCIEFLNNL